MVRVTNVGVSYGNNVYKEFTGLSDDNKPVGGLLTGSVFIEVDTGKAFFYDEESETWMEAGGNNE